jgi:hypothetical protein
MVLIPHIPWCISRVRLCQRVRFGSFSESLRLKELSKKINILHLDKAEGKDENWTILVFARFLRMLLPFWPLASVSALRFMLNLRN